jgi:hypothetical protein
MTPAEFEAPVPGNERQQTYTLDRAAKGISHIDLYLFHF